MSGGFTHPPVVHPRQAPAVVTFRLVADYLVVVEGSIGGLRNLRFGVDTGTSRTVIDRGIARALGLPQTERAMHVFGRHLVAEGVTVPSLAFGRLEVLDLPVLTADLRGQQQPLGIRPDALIGMDVLRHHCFTIDYAAATLTFERTGAWSTRTSFDTRSPYPVVEAVIDGAPYRLIVDSGSEAIVIFETAIPAGKRIEVNAKVAASDLSGTRWLKRFTARDFSVGGHALGTPPVYILSDTADRLGYDGVLASRRLSRTSVYFDFERGDLSWR